MMFSLIFCVVVLLLILLLRLLFRKKSYLASLESTEYDVKIRVIPNIKYMLLIMVGYFMCVFLLDSIADVMLSGEAFTVILYLSFIGFSLLFFSLSIMSINVGEVRVKKISDNNHTK